MAKVEKVIDDKLQKAYNKLFEKFKECDTLPVEEWSINQVLGYFVRSYKNHYGVDYQFKYDKSAPSSCFEIFSIRRIGSLISSDPKIMKDYIDWFFKNKVKHFKKRFTSVSALLKEDITIDYKEYYLSNQVVSLSSVERTTELPEKFLVIVQKFNPSIKTYGNLTFLYKNIGNNKDVQNVFLELAKVGFDIDIMNKIV